MEENRSVGFLCCAAGNITVTAQTDRGGYCPGEAICVSAYINNQMKREVIAVELILHQKTIFISRQGKAFLTFFLLNVCKLVWKPVLYNLKFLKEMSLTSY